MLRIPPIFIGFFIGTAIVQLASGNIRLAIALLILAIGAFLSNWMQSSVNINSNLKSENSHSSLQPNPSAPRLKIVAICTAGSSFLALAASNALNLTTYTTVLIMLILTLTTTLVSLILYDNTAR